AIGSDLLDPTYDGAGALWKRERGTTEETYTRIGDDAANADWLQSPFYRLINSGEIRLRRRFDATYASGEFPLLDAFREQGVTDYVAFVQWIDDSLGLGEFRGMVSSWTTDAPDGFTDDQLAILEAIMPTLTLAATLRTTHRTARTLITTYLGED